jgi:hypothetical protein
MSKLADAYSTAVGCCLNAAISLRRFDSKEAIDELKLAIRLIEDAKRKADREHHLEMCRARRKPIEPAPAAFPVSVENAERFGDFSRDEF